jgi:hypothetical protein
MIQLLGLCELLPLLGGFDLAFFTDLHFPPLGQPGHQVLDSH